MAELPEKPDHGDISLDQLFQLFPDDATSENWFAEQRWPKGPRCPHCGSVKVLSGANHKTMPYRCCQRTSESERAMRVHNFQQSVDQTRDAPRNL